MKEPWLEYSHIWKTKAAFMSWLRGGIRRSLWNKSPIKLEFIKKHRKRIKNPNPKGKVAEVWGGTCALCGGDFPQNQLEVDHIIGHHSLKDFDDILPFILAISCVSEDDLQMVCKSCHKIKNLSEAKGISFDEALIMKNTIEIEKNFDTKLWLFEKGITPGKNMKERRKQIIKILEGTYGS